MTIIMIYCKQDRSIFLLNLDSPLPNSIHFSPTKHVPVCDNSLFTCWSLISQGGSEGLSSLKVDEHRSLLQFNAITFGEHG